MCVVTRERFEKRELMRIVRTPEGDVLIDISGRVNGKGAYLEVINKAKKNKILDKALEVNIPDSLYEDMFKLIEKEAYQK